MLCSVPARNPVSGNDDEDVLVEDELDEDEDEEEEDDRTGACAPGKTQDHTSTGDGWKGCFTS